MCSSDPPPRNRRHAADGSNSWSWGTTKCAVFDCGHPFVELLPGGGAHEVLEHDGHTPERPVGYRAGRVAPRRVEAGADDGVELGVELLDAFDGVVDELGGRCRAGPDHLRQGTGVEEGLGHRPNLVVVVLGRGGDKPGAGDGSGTGSPGNQTATARVSTPVGCRGGERHVNDGVMPAAFVGPREPHERAGGQPLHEGVAPVRRRRFPGPGPCSSSPRTGTSMPRP